MESYPKNPDDKSASTPDGVVVNAPAKQLYSLASVRRMASGVKTRCILERREPSGPGKTVKSEAVLLPIGKTSA